MWFQNELSSLAKVSLYYHASHIPQVLETCYATSGMLQNWQTTLNLNVNNRCFPPCQNHTADLITRMWWKFISCVMYFWDKLLYTHTRIINNQGCRLVLKICLQTPTTMFISKPTNAHRSSITLILKLPQHVSLFLHHPQWAYTVLSAKVINYWIDKIQYSSMSL
jgi:hypothetical protein